MIFGVWYFGIVDNVVIIYEEVLMFSVVFDMFVIFLYCFNKFGFWVEKLIER